MESNQSFVFNRTIEEEIMLSKLRDVLSDILEESMEEVKNSMDEAQG